MAWTPVGDGRYTGDVALDAWSGALDDAAEATTRASGRKPVLAELLDALQAVLDAHGLRAEGHSLAVLRAAAAAPEPPMAPSAKPQTGEVLAIPYDEGRHVAGLVLLGDDGRKLPGNPGLGPCVAAFDLDLPDGSLPDPDVLRRTPWLVPPFHPATVDGWPRLGRVAIPVDRAVLPHFTAGERPGRSGRVYTTPYPPGYERVVRDYFGDRVEPGPGDADRTVPAHVGGFDAVRGAIRARRASPPPAASHPEHPLAAWPVLAWQRPKRARAPKLRPADVLPLLVTALAPAAQRCADAWWARFDRPPDVEEHGHALLQVLCADPSRYLSDPGRVAHARPPAR